MLFGCHIEAVSLAEKEVVLLGSLPALWEKPVPHLSSPATVYSPPTSSTDFRLENRQQEDSHFRYGNRCFNG